MTQRPKIAVHKFTSCDGCQLAFLGLGEPLLEVAQHVEFVHFTEAGVVDDEAQADVAFVEGSVSTPEQAARIQRIRERSRYLITIGACATAGGIQALRNLASDGGAWLERVYATPRHIETLRESTPIAQNVRVDLELWGCPVDHHQVLAAIRALLYGVAPVSDGDKVCMECKRRQAVCVLVARGEPCMGPVTRTGCGAICPRFARDCYACYGPAEEPNAASLARRFEGLGLLPEDVMRRFHFINAYAPAFRDAGGAASDEATDG